jgi:hypothetical protein
MQAALRVHRYTCACAHLPDVPLCAGLRLSQVTQGVKDTVAGDLERKLHTALDDALATIRNEVRRDIAPVAQDVKAIKAHVGM